MSKKEFDVYNSMEDTHWWFTGRRKILTTFLDLIEDQQKKRVLELGCGTGGNLKYLFINFAERFGIDQNEYALQHSKKKLGETVSLRQGDANCLEVEKNAFDCIALLNVLYHKNILDVSKTLRDLHSALKPGGYLLISDEAFESLRGRHTQNVGGARRFTKHQLSYTLEQEQYKIIKISYWGVILFFLLFLKRRILEKWIEPPDSTDNFDVVSVPIIDPILYSFLLAESFFLKRFSLPLGASIAVLAQKPKEP